jgi:hypothetical protein
MMIVTLIKIQLRGLVMLKNYGVVLIYCNPHNHLIIISCGESKKLDGLNRTIDVVAKVNYPYNELELEETLLRSMELCHSKEPDVESKQSFIERVQGINGYGKETKNLKLIQFEWNKEDGYDVRPYQRIPRRGYVIIEEQIIQLGKNIVQCQLAQAVKRAINIAKL